MIHSSRSVFISVFEELQRLNDASAVVSHPLRESVSVAQFKGEGDMPNYSLLVQYTDDMLDRLSRSSIASTPREARRTRTFLPEDSSLERILDLHYSSEKVRVKREQVASVLVRRPPKFPDLIEQTSVVRPKELGALKLTAREMKMEPKPATKPARPVSISFAQFKQQTKPLALGQVRKSTLLPEIRRPSESRASSGIKR